MAKPLSPDELIRAFDKWNVKHRQHPGWRTHRRDPGHGAWGPVHGIGLHHTGDDAPDSADAKTLWNGRSDLPGPLCTWGQTDEGVAILMSGGRSNHFGGGDPNVLDAVISEDYHEFPPQTHFHEGSPGAADGNTHFYGQETMYSGSHKMSRPAYVNTVKAFAAVCDAHHWSAKSAIGHKEWSDDKPDPGQLNMKRFRDDLQDCLDAGPGNWPPAS